MIIQNFDSLATSPLRKQALLIAEAGLQALAPDSLVERHVQLDPRGRHITVGPHKLHLKDYKNVVLAKIGDAAAPVVSSIKKLLGHHITKTVEAEHELVASLEPLNVDDLVILVVADDGQSLYHPALPSYEGHSIVGALVDSQATTGEIDTVRHHLSHVLGGNLARAAHPARVVTLVYGGQDAGLVSMDRTTSRDAAEILEKYKILDKCGLPACELLETPKDQKYFQNTQSVNLASWDNAFAAMAAKVDDLAFPQHHWQPAFDELRDQMEVDLPEQLWYIIYNKFR